VVVVPSAVDLGAVPPGPVAGVRDDLGIPDSAPLIGTVGRLDAQKDPLTFVRMARRVADDRPDARFVWVGEGPLLDAARAEAARLGVDVLFTGFRADAPRVASAFDVYVVSSLYEGVGRSLTEAMAAGRPVVATAVDGINDVVVHGTTGLLAPARDPAALASGVVWMLTHDRDAERMGAQARTMVRGLFSHAVMCDGLDRVYRRLLGLPDPPVVVGSDGVQGRAFDRREAGAPRAGLILARHG
jgi:glycosyltransferase involved in cell wall biosynthesis